MKLNFKKPDLPLQVAAQAITKHFQFTQFEKDIINTANYKVLILDIKTNSYQKIFKQNWDIKGISLYNDFMKFAEKEEKTYLDICYIIYLHYKITKHKSKNHNWLKQVIKTAIKRDEKCKLLYQSGTISINYSKTYKTVSLYIKGENFVAPIRFTEEGEISL